MHQQLRTYRRKHPGHAGSDNASTRCAAGSRASSAGVIAARPGAHDSAVGTLFGAQRRERCRRPAHFGICPRRPGTRSAAGRGAAVWAVHKTTSRVVEQSACAPIMAVASLARQSWESIPRTSPLDPTVGTSERHQIPQNRCPTSSNLPQCFMSTSTRAMVWCGISCGPLGCASDPHIASVIARHPAGPDGGDRFGKAVRYRVRPETESAADYLAVLRPLRIPPRSSGFNHHR